MNRRIGAGIALGAFAIVFVLAGWMLLFSTFMIYDDEGYVLLSLRNFSQHGELYDQVYSQYGPFYFAAFDLLHRLLAFEWTNTAGRWITLVEWCLTAASCGALVWRRMRSTAAAVGTAGGVFTCLWVMIHEPIHPGGLIGLLVALVAWLGTVWDPAVRQRGAALVGAIGAALLLTKINVGGFLLIAVATWMTIHAAAARWQRWGTWAAAAIIVLLPWVLMRSLADQAWVLEFAAIATCSGVGAVLAARTSARQVTGRPQLLAFATAAAGVTIATVALVLARGTTPGGLLNGVLWEPLRHPGVYSFAFNWRPGSLLVATAGVVLVGLAVARPSAAALRAVVLARWAAALVASLSVLKVLPVAPAPLALSYGVALAGLCALPLRADAAGMEDARVRQWIALLLVLQMLHAFPVAGSQLNWGTFLWIPLVVLALHDAWLAWPPAGTWRRRGSLAGSMAAFLLAIFMGGTLLHTGWQNRNQGEPLRLPGANDIVVPDDSAFSIRIVAANVRAHGHTLFSLPGLYSFNLWTGCPTPTLANATHWFSLLSTDAQHAIITQLDADPRSMLVVQEGTFWHLVDRGFPIKGPLASYLAREFAPAFRVDSYAIWTRRGRALAPLHTGALRPDAEVPAAMDLELVLPAVPAPVARVEVWQLTPRGRRAWATLSAADAAVRTTVLDEHGRASEAEHTLAWPFALSAPFNRVRLKFRPATDPPRDLLVLLFDAAGDELTAARILP